MTKEHFENFINAMMLSEDEEEDEGRDTDYHHSNCDANESEG